MKVDPVQGQLAVTAYREGQVWLELCLHTSRTHQMWVRCAALKRSVLGNPVHNSVEREPLHLHARAVPPPPSILMNDYPPLPGRQHPYHIQAYLRSLGSRALRVNNNYVTSS